MDGWLNTDIIFRLGVLGVALAVVPTIVRRRVGGGLTSYLALTVGLVVLLIGQSNELLKSAMPGWWNTPAALSAYLPTHAGGALLILVGFLSLMCDLRLARTRTEAAAAQDRACTEKAYLEREKLRLILNCASEYCIIACDLDGSIVSYSEGGLHTLGWRADEVVGQMNVSQLRPDDTPVTLEQLWAAVASDGFFEAEVDMIRKGGRRFPALLTLSPLKGSDGALQGYVGIVKDITEMKAAKESIEKAKTDLERANEELARLAATDFLTGLMNRRQAAVLLEHELRRTRRSGKPLSVVFMDLDHFKAVNDTYGHEAGDEVLKHVADTMRSRLRAGDVIARYGGEEFLLVLPESTLEGAANVAELLRRRLYDTPAKYGDITIRVSSSFGVAVLEPSDQQGVDTLVRMADEAMFCAKNLGGNRVVTWNLVREGQIEPSLATSAEVHGLEKRIEVIAQHTDVAVLEDIFRLVDSLDAHSPYSRSQSRHVARYATAIANEMGLPKDTVETIYRAAMLRDLGRNAISAEMLWKAGPLSKTEWAIVCQHPVVSVKILSRLKCLKQEPLIIRHHHERPDGRGYPDGLSGDAIPMESRVLAAAEALEAMTRARPHRPALTLAETLRQLRGGVPQQFDPEVVAATERVAAQATDWPLATQPEILTVAAERN
ncbi:MAG: diguanylate cyclase [Planctomycetota bacterium]|nr:diguanylate cyclase [Planctomycetota bacterium]